MHWPRTIGTEVLEGGGSGAGGWRGGEMWFGWERGMGFRGAP
jgi:hypothetical protein